MRKLAARFKPILDTVWLVALEKNCPRDLRKLLLAWVAPNLFNWETDVLRQDFLLRRQWNPIQRQPYIKAVVAVTEKCPKLPFPRAIFNEDTLRLQRVSLREFNFQPQKKVFRWLQK